MLNEDQTNHFWEHGYIVASGVAAPEVCETLLEEFNTWREESREHDANYGFDTVDGKARFDLEEGHSAEHPKLRRVANPVDISGGLTAGGYELNVRLRELDEVPGSTVRYSNIRYATECSKIG